LCFTYVPQVKRDKLDKKAVQGIFIGYSTISKAYKVFQPETGNIVISKDVHFVENEEWVWDTLKVSNQASNQIKNVERKTSEEEWKNEMVDDIPIRGTRLLSDVYQRCSIAVCEPANFNEAKLDKKWTDAMKKELHMIEKNNTWKLVYRPQDRKSIGVKWVFRTKLNVDGSINKHKVRLVVKGYAQIFGVDYSYTFAPFLQ